MIKSVLLAAVCAMSSLACEITCIENCHDDDGDQYSGPHRGGGGGKAGGSSASGGTSATTNESAGVANCGGTGATAGSPSDGGHSSPPTRCSKESDCERGFNCDYESKECTPADAETCGELSTEADCDNRNDCVSIYAGTNCSCGPECTCVGGEPGCVCQSFAFFTCQALED